MCNCDDNINSSEVFSGPQGPQGPQGDTPVISGTSTTNLTIGTGSTTLTTQSGIAWSVGQRVRITNSNASKVMEGPITSYSSTTLVVNVTYTIGSGSNASWTIVICGEVGSTGATGSTGSTGATGPTGSNAFTQLSTITPLSSTTYQLGVIDSSWMVIGQVIFIENLGYYKVLTNTPIHTVTVLDLAYFGNNPSYTPAGGANISPAGLSGIQFLYETTDGNNIPTQGNGIPNGILTRNASDNGYVFLTPTQLKVILAGLTPIGAW